jgi:hypothetical protein
MNYRPHFDTITLMESFKKHIFAYTLIPLTVMLVSASFYRFIVLHDYLVSYEIDCDPSSESCFIGCEDDECTAEYFYALIERRADDIYNLCGPNIVECEAALECSQSSTHCNITYCNPDIDEEGTCSTIHSENSL